MDGTYNLGTSDAKTALLWASIMSSQHISSPQAMTEFVTKKKLILKTLLTAKADIEVQDSSGTVSNSNNPNHSSNLWLTLTWK